MLIRSLDGSVSKGILEAFATSKLSDIVFTLTVFKTEISTSYESNVYQRNNKSFMCMCMHVYVSPGAHV